MLLYHETRRKNFTESLIHGRWQHLKHEEFLGDQGYKVASLRRDLENIDIFGEFLLILLVGRVVKIGVVISWVDVGFYICRRSVETCPFLLELVDQRQEAANDLAFKNFVDEEVRLKTSIIGSLEANAIL